MKKLYNFLMLLWIASLVISTTNVAAQGKADKPKVLETYEGVLLDNTKKPIANAVVSIQEGDRSTTTNAEGKFAIDASIADALVIKKDGFLTQIIKLGDKTSLNINLKPSRFLAGDDDNIEIPYGMRKLRDITAAISQVSTADLPQPSTSALSNSLTGRLAGLSVFQSNVQPGSDIAVFQVRGRNSYNFSNARVFVDGIQREFIDIDFDEVETFTVLKDAAALSWYGLRGSNGVILVTTKKGSATKSSLNFNAQFGLQNPDHIIDPLNSFEYASLYNEAATNDNLGAQLYTQGQLDAYQNGSSPFLNPSNNYVNDFIRKTPVFQRYTASAQGGNSNIRYFTLLGYLNQGGIFEGTDGPNYDSNNGYKRFNFRANVDIDVNKSFTVGVNLAGRVENRLNPANSGANNATSNLLSLIYNTKPDAYPILNEDGSLGGTNENQVNLLGALSRGGLFRNKQRVGFANINATHKLDFITKGLSANAIIGYDSRGDYASGFKETYRVFDFSSGAATPVVFGEDTNYDYTTGNTVGYSNSYRSSVIWAGLDYERGFGNHNINASLKGNRSEVSDFSSFSDVYQRLQSLSSRVEYNYKQKYFLSFVSSLSGDDDLPSGGKYGFFPAVSAGWIISDENFLKNNGIISFLKLRGSYGQTGNTEIGFDTRFPYRSAYVRNLAGNGAGYQFGTGFANTGSASERNLGNPFITWETFTSANLGLDFNLFNNTFSATIDVFKNNRDGILTNSSLPDILGQSITRNEGEVDSKGVEGSLNYNKTFGDFKLGLNANFLISESEIIYQGNQFGPSYQSSIGLPAGSGLYFVSDGLFQSQAEIDAAPKSTLANKIYPGDIRYKDLNNDTVIDDLDQMRITRGSKPAYYGFGTNLKFKSFDFNAQFIGVTGRVIDIKSLVYSGPSNFNRLSLNRWTPATAATAEYPRVGLANLGNNRANSDFFLRNANYFKLKTTEIGYTIPSKVASKLKMQSLRIFVSGFNLFSFSQLDLDVDPELPYAGYGNDYPYVSTYSFGINAKF